MWNQYHYFDLPKTWVGRARKKNKLPSPIDGSCPTANKNTPQNSNEFCLIVFSVRSKCPMVSFPIIDI